MIAPSHNSRIFLYRKPVDFRFGFDRLAALAKEASQDSPYNGQIYVFLNRSFTRAKVVFFDGTGCCMLWKRLEKGKFKPDFEKSSKGFATLGSAEMMLLLEGARMDKMQKAKTWKPTKPSHKNLLPSSAGLPNLPVTPEGKNAFL